MASEAGQAKPATTWTKAASARPLIATWARPSPKMSRFRRQQPLGMELEPDQEEQQHDPEIGDVEHLLGRVDQAAAPPARSSAPATR